MGLQILVVIFGQELPSENDTVRQQVFSVGVAAIGLAAFALVLALVEQLVLQVPIKAYCNRLTVRFLKSRSPMIRRLCIMFTNDSCVHTPYKLGGCQIAPTRWRCG